jgi:hypothetical protein
VATAQLLKSHFGDRIAVNVALKAGFRFGAGFGIGAAGIGNGFYLCPDLAPGLHQFGQGFCLALCGSENLFAGQGAEVPK